VEGKNIPPPDNRPTADTYVVLSILGEKKKTLTEKTKPQKKGLDAPKWAQSFDLYVLSSTFATLICAFSSIDHNAAELHLLVQDWNRIVASEVLASATIPISKDIVAGTPIDKWFPLTKPGSKKTSGEVHLKITFAPKKKKGESKSNLSPAGSDRRPSLKTTESVTTRSGKSEKVRARCSAPC
jgi:Ca2+-dependent lipid-binding protein